jgi:hypothetical protein
MVRPNTLAEEMAREAADRLQRAHDAGEQLSFLPDEKGGALVEGKDGARPPRGPGKAMSQMRDWLAVRGYRMPEDVLAEMSGLASSADAVLEAMAKAERILEWAYDGDAAGKSPSSAQRLATFMQVYTLQLRAAEALLPYGMPKATPDVQVNQQNVFLVSRGSAEPADPGAVARDVTPSRAGRMRPPPMPGEIQQNQPLGETAARGSDGEARTE